MKLITEADRIPDNFTGIVEYNGTKEWYRNGELHRESGPAIEDANGDKWWYLNGKLHRESGPACEYANGYKCWYLNGIKYTESAYKAELSKRSTTPPCNGKIVEIDGKKYQLTAI